MMDGHQTSDPAKSRANNRREAVLDAAAALFRRQGYAATTMRDIAADAGMLAGSLYYHFSAKSALLLAVYEEGVRRITAAVDTAVAKVQKSGGGPWAQLEAALAAHLESLLDEGDYAQVMIRDLPADDPDLSAAMIGLRDDYENRFRNLVAALPLDDEQDRVWVRLILLGAANWSKTWYRPGGARPAEIAAGFVRLLRRGNDGRDGR